MPPRKPQFTEAHEEKIDKMKEFMAIHTALSASISQKLEDMSRVMREMHDKLDQSLIMNTKKFTELEGKDALYEERLNSIKEEQKSRALNWWTVGGLIVTILAAIIGAILTNK
jgi:BMFP domain-containing protein YqiC